MSTAALLTPEEVADLLQVAPKRVMELRREHDWPHVRLGRRIRFTQEQVEAIVASRTVGAGGAAVEEQRPAPVFSLTPGSRRAAQRADTG